VPVKTVREATFDVLRHFGMTTIFSNPGSTEIPFLVDLPEDLSFVLGLHEGSVVGMATGAAIASDRPTFVLLHTTAGLGNAVGALATARVNRAGLVVVVGQQDRRHLVAEPFLAGQLEGLAGNYPVWAGSPARAVDVPSMVARAYHEAAARRGPAIVVVPMNDWAEPASEDVRIAAPLEMRVSAGVDEEAADGVAEAVAAAHSPVLVVGSGADDPRTWSHVVRIAESLGCPVWQEPFGARAGYPQDHAQFAGHLPASRPAVRDALRGHDLVLLIGAPALRQYGYADGPLFEPGMRVLVLTDDPSEAAYSTADLAFVAPLPALCVQVAERVPRRDTDTSGRRESARPPRHDTSREQLVAADVYQAISERLPADAMLVEESPSTRSQLQDLVPARQTLGFLSAAMGGLGFAMPAATGAKMATPSRPVVAVVGDGSSLYAIQSLWSAQHYCSGVLFVVLSNGGYAIMDKLADDAGGKAPWPSFADVSVAGMARALGCPSMRVETRTELLAHLDEITPSLATRTEPFLLEVAVSPQT
jgi:benzoylformate decarboxylase